MTLTLSLIAGFLAALARCAAFLYAAPIVGDNVVPARVRLMAAVSLAAAVTALRGPMEIADLPLIIPGEVLLGALAGFAARVVVAGAEAGGQLIGLQIGLGFAASYDPALGESALPARRIAWCLAGIAFFGAGGLEAAVPALAGPPASALALVGGVAFLVREAGEMFIIAIRFAAPAIIAGLIANLVMALASRAAPALNVFSVMLAGVLLIGGTVLLATRQAFVRELAALGYRAADAAAGVLP